MKMIGTKKKKKVGLYENEEESGSSSHSVADWAITDRTKFKVLAKASKAEGKRPPEFWIRDGERRRIRFVDDDALASFNVYTVMKNGKPTRYVQPPEGDTDHFASMGLRSSRVFLFRIIDIDGYTVEKGKDKGKRMQNLPRFYVVGARMYEQIKLQVVQATDTALNAGDVIVMRSGEGKSAAYTFIARPSSITPAAKAAIAKFPKWTEFYRPLSPAQQQAATSAMDHDAD